LKEGAPLLLSGPERLVRNAAHTCKQAWRRSSDARPEAAASVWGSLAHMDRLCAKRIAGNCIL